MVGKLVRVMALCTLLTFAAACGNGVSLKTDGGSVKINNDSIVVKDEQGDAKISMDGKDGKIEYKSEDGKGEISFSGENGGKLPDDYPKSLVPIMQDAKITLASRNEDEDKKLGFWITYTSEKEIKEVYKFYEDNLKSLEEEAKIQAEDMYSITGRKDGNNIGVTISPEETDGKKHSLVQVIIGPDGN